MDKSAQEALELDDGETENVSGASICECCGISISQIGASLYAGLASSIGRETAESRRIVGKDREPPASRTWVAIEIGLSFGFDGVIGLREA
jgi:hypothetical protein